MKLKRLIIHGFKSFKDKTTINFDDKITGIVGPNGCGKSNIVDALFWVMGEQSAKHLRGKSMKDVIFAGSSKFKPGNWAQATLVIENNEGKHIHIGNKVCAPSEIELSRKLYRNGETEYRINGEICRLKDIHEVFMDTGAGAKSYSIIAQGEINRMVQARPEERRVMIEEVAGITKFKARKRESLKKMEQTSENIKKIDDLQLEIDKNLKTLQKQSEKAGRAKSLKSKIQNNDLIVHSHKEFDYLNEFKIASECISQKENDLSIWIPEKEVLETSLVDEKIKRDLKSKDLKEQQTVYNEVSRLLAASEERFDHLCKNISSKETQIERREDELIQFDEELQERLLKKEQMQDDLEELLETGNNGFEYSDLEIEVDTLKERSQELSIDKNEFEVKLKQKNESITIIENNLFKITSKLDETSINIQDLSKEIEDLEGRYSGVSTILASQRSEVALSKESLTSLTEEEASVKEDLKCKKDLLKSLRIEVNELEKNYIKTTSRLSSLQEISKALDGVNAGTSEFLVDNPNYELLGNLIHCDEKYSKSVQMILCDLLNTIVGDGDEIKSWLDKDGIDKTTQYISGGQSSYYSENEVKERLELRGFKVTSLNEILTDVPKVSKNILAGHFVVDTVDLNNDIENLKDIQFHSISSLDGNILLKNINGSVLITTGLNSNSGMGMVERNNLIDSLISEEKELIQKKTQAELELTKLEEDVSLKQDLYDQKINDLSDIKTKVATLDSALEGKISQLEEGQARLQILQERKGKTSSDRLDLLEEQEKESSSLSENKELLVDLKENTDANLFEFNSTNELLTIKQEELSQIKIEASTYHQKKKSYSSQIEDIESQIERATDKKQKILVLVNELKEEKESVEIDVRELEVDNLEKSKGLEEKNIELKTKRKEVEILNSEMKSREDKVKKLSKIIISHDKDLVGHKSRIERTIEEEELLVKDIFERYQIDLRETLGNFLEFQQEDLVALGDISDIFSQESENGLVEIQKESYEFNRRYGQDLRSCQEKLRRYKKELNQLGEINWQAMEDYQRQKLRHDFLAHQKEELMLSLKDLGDAISQIDEKSKSRFKMAFEEVTEKFEKVFPIIFGGGHAKLSLVGDLDEVDCGIDIMASPPGKKMQNINLMSGGEKAMTAVSLIFSIFLVKPSPFCLLDEVDAPLDDANVGRFNQLLREMSGESQFILITHNKKTMELNNKLYGVTMQEPGVSSAVSVQLQ